MVNCDLESPEAKGLKARPPPKIAGRAGWKNKKIRTLIPWEVLKVRQRQSGHVKP